MFKKLLYLNLWPKKEYLQRLEFNAVEVIIMAILNFLIYSIAYQLNGSIVVPNIGTFYVGESLAFGAGAVLSQAIIAFIIYFLLVRTGWAECSHLEAFGLVFFTCIPSWLFIFLEQHLEFYWILWAITIIWRVALIAFGLRFWKMLNTRRAIIIPTVSLILLALFTVHTFGLRI